MQGNDERTQSRGSSLHGVARHLFVSSHCVLGSILRLTPCTQRQINSSICGRCIYTPLHLLLESLPVALFGACCVIHCSPRSMCHL